MTKLTELKNALVAWRNAEKAYAVSTLRAEHPLHLTSLKNKEEYALHAIRIIVDSEPWADLEQGL